ncbi:MAG: carbon-nitrogen family hydrolase [Clostridiales bacterium]|nr:carbon-nitrogen family hydrolase [Clostridiales bacterium]
MKLAMCQTDMFWEDKEKNLEAAEEFIKEAAENSADLIIFPEMSFTGFSVKTAEMGEEYRTSKTVENIKLLAAENKIAVGFGMTVSENGTNLNRFVMADKEGKEVGFYDKIHPFSYGDEGRLFTGGDKTTVVTVEGVRIALYVCYDLRFPEIFSAASNNADMAVVIANWPSSRISQWSALLRARAIENQYYVAGVNRTGTGDGIEYNGRSAAFDYSGALMAEAGSQPGLTYCEILPENVAHFRNKFKMLRDRKPELYKKLLH